MRCTASPSAVATPAPILIGVDPIRLAVLIALHPRTSFLAPPFGFSLFHLGGAAPPEVTITALWRGVVPLILLDLHGMTIIFTFPPRNAAAARAVASGPAFTVLGKRGLPVSATRAVAFSVHEA